jgi:type IV pilus assembly protein PilY1
MGKLNKILLPFIFFSIILTSGVCLGDERDIFLISVNPDALILLDLSGSMNWDPAGNYCYTTGCSKLAMAQNAIKAILDDNADGTIDSKDEASLAIRIGYMRFYNCPYDDTGGSYSSGCNSLINAIPNTDPPPYSSPSRYSDVWGNVNAEYASGGTPLASALGEARMYLDVHKGTDSAKACRQKYVILVTDGQDTFSCNGDGNETKMDMYKRRKATVAKAKALSDAGYKVYVVGFGANMPADLMNTLNWAAYYGGTDNPSASKSGDTGAITPSTNPCGEGSSNDPGQASLSGYAFMATSASEISGALRTAFGLISQSMISFSVASVAASRVASENFLYEASFKPFGNDPFWAGHLKKYSINTDGSVGSMLWDAGDLLRSKDPSTRQIFTYLSGSMTSFVSGIFSSPTLAKQYLDVDTSNDAQAVVGYFRGESSFNPDNWKLGDIFHSNPITVGSPSAYFVDIRSPQAFVDFRSSHTGRDRIVVVGTNDGQFRAFSGNDGSEKWSFIPPNLLPKLKYISHSTHPTTKQHVYFVDGPVTVGDVWLGNGDGTSKAAGDWHSLMVFAEGKGIRNSNDEAAFLWSSSSSCDSDFNKEYAPDHPNYCGYYAFDVTDTSASQPALKWLLNFPASGSQTQQYLGEPWSRMAIGKVIINGNEKWVGFLGGGYFKDGDKGKGFFVVDLSNGGVIWSLTKGDVPSMDSRIPASPAIVDTDNDGFIDTAYIGDLGGNVWRFKFCTGADGNACGISNWSGGKSDTPRRAGGLMSRAASKAVGRFTQTSR